ncbi:hypothetical protein BN2127_JRS3_03635 [Bacillus safensis]|uniref:hypothetical protein n=1 Tax=Bacillus safensis TaxID=561879 RepID=UPI0006A85CEC|nr:hypothetical protein [Bacillus safensis]CUB23881.1 hypothetical protein BN2127_JRS3_03635 [Bacillus safensis]
MRKEGVYYLKDEFIEEINDHLKNVGDQEGFRIEKRFELGESIELLNFLFSVKKSEDEAATLEVEFISLNVLSH